MVANPPLPPFQTLLDTHAEAVLRFLRGAVGPVDADDCFQDTFVAALRAYPRLRHGRELRAWLLTIARRKALDHYRASARRPRPVAEVPEPGAGAGATALASGGGAGENGSVESGALWAVVSELPEGQRAALALRYAGGLRFREVAEALGCSEDAARRRVHDGLKTLRRRSSEIEELVR